MCCLLEGFPFFILPTGKTLTETSVSVFNITTKNQLAVVILLFRKLLSTVKQKIYVICKSMSVCRKCMEFDFLLLLLTFSFQPFIFIKMQNLCAAFLVTAFRLDI